MSFSQHSGFSKVHIKKLWRTPGKPMYRLSWGDASPSPISWEKVCANETEIQEQRYDSFYGEDERRGVKSCLDLLRLTNTPSDKIGASVYKCCANILRYLVIVESREPGGFANRLSKATQPYVSKMYEAAGIIRSATWKGHLLNEDELRHTELLEHLRGISHGFSFVLKRTSGSEFILSDSPVLSNIDSRAIGAPISPKSFLWCYSDSQQHFRIEDADEEYTYNINKEQARSARSAIFSSSETLLVPYVESIGEINRIVDEQIAS